MKQQLSHALKLSGFVLIAGADKEIDVIDVSRQCDLKMRLGDFVEYYNSPNRERVLNVISLEFSETRYTSISTSLITLHHNILITGIKSNPYYLKEQITLN